MDIKDIDMKDIDKKDDAIEKVKEIWIHDGVKNYFSKPGDLVNLLEPLVLALNWKGNYRQLVESLPHFADTLTLTDFLNVMVEINYNNEHLSCTLDKIPSKFIPCLFIPADGQAMLVISQNDKGLNIIDGSTGKETHINKINTRGVVYYFSQFNVDKIIVTKRVESFTQILHRFRPLITQIFILTLLYNIFMAVVPIYIMMVYDKVIPSQSYTMALSFLVGVLIFLYSAQLLAVARIKIIAYIGARLDKTIGEAIIRHLLYLSPTYTESNTVGVQIARIKSFDNIRDFFTGSIAIMACEFPFSIIFLALIFMIGGWLGFVPLILGLLFFAVYYVANPIVDKYTKFQSTQSMMKQTFLLESFARERDIKETGMEDVWNNKFDLMLINLSRSGFNYVYYNSILNIMSELFMMLAALTMLAFGAVLSMNDAMTLGMLIATMMLTWKVLNPMKSFFSSLPKMEQILSSVSQVNKLFSIPTEQTVERRTVVNEAKKAKIEFNKVTFRYRPDLGPAILGISFIVQPGELICVTGKNSAGKSTLLRLILGLYKPQAGNILINNMNIQQFDPIELRHTISYMPQTNQIFYGTIRQNILLGDMTSTEEDVLAAARLAGIHDEIMRLPEQYNTRIGDHKSFEFTATFIQSIVLARTYLKTASIILLDEPASGFDEEMEKKFIEVINYKRKESTIIWVTHRPSHLKIADKVLYMENGEVALYGAAEKVLEKLPRNLI